MAVDALPGALASLSRLSPQRQPEDDRNRLETLRSVAVDFEAQFLAQMLDHAGVGRTPEGFGGGPGEEAFRGELIGQQAKLMANRGGIGIADTIFRAIAAREGLEP